ncbi:hypothetical protein O6H91_06G017100 [Diphasiastrum complanatum]|uniref:Uncharacterized protein n=1 Tax=Diphasiastrum complanatum TaxID=34168 RepID=A0ACC2DB45_DIPCM|nr:hypothetical protein O6H91_06G017100 [Diphasiastrum complanatum]
MHRKHIEIRAQQQESKDAKMGEIVEEPVQLESLNISLGSFSVCDPPSPQKVTYYYSRMSANNICFLYRVTTEESLYRCHPEAKGWPELLLTKEELDQHFRELSEDNIYWYKSRAGEETHSGVRYPDMDEFRRHWHVGTNVFFRYNDMRSTGIVVGRFVWEEMQDCSHLRLLLLLQMPTNKLLLSSEVTDLEIDPDVANNKEEVYIQGISLVGIVATLIANVTYLASVTPPRGFDSSPGHDGVAFASSMKLPTVFLFFNSIAFYSSVLAVVVMTAFIPIYGTAGEWGAIFLSSSLPVVLSLIAFYIAFMFSSWASLGSSWLKPFFITLLGIAMVLYVRFWAIELMEGHIDRHLRVMLRISPWEWYIKRASSSGSSVPGFLERCERSFKSIAESILSQRSVKTTSRSSKREQEKARFIFRAETRK